MAAMTSQSPAPSSSDNNTTGISRFVNPILRHLGDQQSPAPAPNFRDQRSKNNYSDKSNHENYSNNYRNDQNNHNNYNNHSSHNNHSSYDNNYSNRYHDTSNWSHNPKQQNSSPNKYSMPAEYPIPASSRGFYGSNRRNYGDDGNRRNWHDDNNNRRNYNDDGHQRRYQQMDHHPRVSSTGTQWDVRHNRVWHAESAADVFQDECQRISAGINFHAYENIPVELVGPNHESIQPLTCFGDVKITHPQMTENISRFNYSSPTPVQKYSIPVVLGGHDLMACAQTGSGKTAAFLYPIILKMLNTGPPPPKPIDRAGSRLIAGPVCLILSPTRELAVQIYREARKFAYNTGIVTHVVYGGSSYREQSMSLGRSGTDMCVATPGRLLELIDRHSMHLSQISYLVLDEADRMLDMGFNPQIIEIVENRKMTKSVEGRQTIMFSATFPREIQDMAKKFLHNYLFLSVGRVGSTNEFIKQQFIYANEDSKPQRLLRVLAECKTGLTLIFVETKRKTDMINKFLCDSGFDAVCLHGDKSQIDREKALSQFRAGRIRILVATDVAARGLDINHVEHVINCDIPSRIEDYIHRIGRTGRAGNHGKAISFVNEQNKPILRDLMSLLEESQQEIPGWFYELVMSCTSAAHGHFQQHYNSGHRNKTNRNHHDYNSGNKHKYTKHSYDDDDGW